jgi:RNA polymerase sigma-70 factor (ECF subfamily)
MEQVEALFRMHYAFVCRTVLRYVGDRAKAEDIAQDVFAELWTKRDTLTLHTSPQAYLRRMAISRALNHLRDNRKHHWDEIDDGVADQAAHVPAEAILAMEERELAEQVNAAIDRLPEKCRIVFQLSRVDQMSYAEIADALRISVKTVENQIGKALRILREQVDPHRRG